MNNKQVLPFVCFYYIKTTTLFLLLEALPSSILLTLCVLLVDKLVETSGQIYRNLRTKL